MSSKEKGAKGKDALSERRKRFLLLLNMWTNMK